MALLFRVFSIPESLNPNPFPSFSVVKQFVAFSGPLAKRREIEPGVFTMDASDYVPLFKRIGVTCVVRFNKKCYDRRKFLDNGINHVDLFYEDGECPHI